MIRRTIRLCAALTLLAGCGDAGPAPEAPAAAPASSPAAAGRKPVIAVVPKATTYEFWKSVHAGVLQGERLAGVQVIWRGPLSENDRETQINLIQDLVTQKVDGICLAPLDSQSLIAPVREAVAEGIPVLIFDSPLNERAGTLGFVGTDNRAGGVLAARRLGELLGGKGRIVVLRYTPGSQSTELRESGFLETLAKEFPGIRVLSSSEYAGATAETALEKSQQLLNRYGDELDGIFTSCQHVTAGMLKALQERDLAGRLKFVGFDAAPDLVEGIRKGHLHGLVLQDPVRMGERAVALMAEHLSGKSIPARVSTGEAVATPENLGEPRIRALLNPEQVESAPQ